jgi:hypothetical protein
VLGGKCGDFSGRNYGRCAEIRTSDRTEGGKTAGMKEIRAEKTGLERHGEQAVRLARESP